MVSYFGSDTLLGERAIGTFIINYFFHGGIIMTALQFPFLLARDKENQDSGLYIGPGPGKLTSNGSLGVCCENQRFPFMGPPLRL